MHDDVLAFWFEQTEPAQWWASDPALDALNPPALRDAAAAGRQRRAVRLARLPRVKSVRSLPDDLDAATVLALLLAEPLLIRRLLIEVAGWRTVGFDAAKLERQLGVHFATAVPDGCSRH